MVTTKSINKICNMTDEEINQLDENQLSLLRKVLFKIVNKELITKIKKIYESESSNITSY